MESRKIVGEGNGTPLQHSCLENPMDRGAWWATVHGVAKRRTRLSDFTFISQSGKNVTSEQPSWVFWNYTLLFIFCRGWMKVGTSWQGLRMGTCDLIQNNLDTCQAMNPLSPSVRPGMKVKLVTQRKNSYSRQSLERKYFLDSPWKGITWGTE